MDRKTAAIDAFLKKQSVLDLNLTLAELSERLKDGGEIAGYTFAWDKYVYKTADVAQLEQGAKPSSRNVLGQSMLNLNVRMSDLISLARDTGIDEVAGYVYTEDKFTFIVASVEELGTAA